MTGKKLKLFLQGIEDKKSRDNFAKIEAFVNDAIMKAITSVDGITVVRNYGSASKINRSTAEAVHIGDPTVDGSWRITVAGPDLVIEVRENGSWKRKDQIQP